MRIYNFTDDIGVFNTNIDTESIIKDLYELRDKDTKSDGASNVRRYYKTFFSTFNPVIFSRNQKMKINH